MIEMGKLDHHTAYLDGNVIKVYNPRGLIGEFSVIGEICGVWRPESRWESDTSKKLVKSVINHIQDTKAGERKRLTEGSPRYES